MNMNIYAYLQYTALNEGVQMFTYSHFLSFSNHRQFCLELNGLAVKLQVPSCFLCPLLT